MPRSRTGIVAVGVIALVAGIAMFAPMGGADDAPDRGAVRMRADAVCRRAVSDSPRLPRPENRADAIALAVGMAKLLRSTASDLRSAGADDLAWAHQRWAAAIDDVRQALRRRGGSAKAGAAALVAGRDASAAARAFGARDCVLFARSG